VDREEERELWDIVRNNQLVLARISERQEYEIAARKKSDERFDEHAEKEEEMMGRKWYKSWINIGSLGIVCSLLFTSALNWFEITHTVKSLDENTAIIQRDVGHLKTEFDSFKETVSAHMQDDLLFRANVVSKEE